MQTLNRLADMYATFEDTVNNVENEISENDILFAETRKIMNEFAAFQLRQMRKSWHCSSV